MVWLAFDLSIALAGFTLLLLGRWIIDVVHALLRRPATQQTTPPHA